MTDDHGVGVFELEGIWLSKGGRFERVEDSLSSEEYSDEDDLQAQSNQIGERHRYGLSKIISGRRKPTSNVRQEVLKGSNEVQGNIKKRRKALEVITDTPGAFGGKSRGKRVGGTDGLLASVMGWEYLLGDMFSIDHVCISIEGMCLVQDCIGGIGQPVGLGDVFFRRSVFLLWQFDLKFTELPVVPSALPISSIHGSSTTTCQISS